MHTFVVMAQRACRVNGSAACIQQTSSTQQKPFPFKRIDALLDSGNSRFMWTERPEPTPHAG
jgi:hypothetical protein